MPEKLKPTEKFDFIIAFLSIWFIFGVYIDGWAHNHIIDEIETFFSPWHAIMYSGYLAVSLAIVIKTILDRRPNLSIKYAVPKGYFVSLIGSLIFLAGGFGDLIWHELFGFEISIEALLSPTHLVLAFGAVFILGGLILSAHKNKSSSFYSKLPMVIALALILSVFTFMTQYNHPYTKAWPIELSFDSENNQRMGIQGILLYSLMLMGVVLFAMKFFDMPKGSFTIILTFNAVLMGMLRDYYIFIVTALIAGFLADLLYNYLQPSFSKTKEILIFSFAVPAMFVLVYFLTLASIAPLLWSIHLWTGTIVISGLFGAILAYLMEPAIF